MVGGQFQKPITSYNCGVKMPDKREKLLINLLFEIGLLVKNEPDRFVDMTDEKFRVWIKSVLVELGYDVPEELVLDTPVDPE